MEDTDIKYFNPGVCLQELAHSMAAVPFGIADKVLS